MSKSTTKKCKHCKTEIPANAKVCPHCQKKQGGNIKLIIIGIACLFIFFLVVGNSGSDKPLDVSPSPSVASLSSATPEPQNTTSPDITATPELQDTTQPDLSSDVTAAPETPSTENVTTGQRNALKSAQSYLSISAFSYTGLIKQLEFEQYSHEDAVYAADNCGADWNEQAANSAQSYLSFSAFSYTGLIKQLEFDGYTNDEAVYAADNCGADWKEQAAKAAASYLEFSSFSRDGLIQQLEFDGYTHDEAIAGVETNGY